MKDSLGSAKIPPVNESYENKDFFQKYMHINDSRSLFSVMKKNRATMNDTLNPIYPRGFTEAQNTSNSHQSKTIEISKNEPKTVTLVSSKRLKYTLNDKSYLLALETSHLKENKLGIDQQCLARRSNIHAKREERRCFNQNSNADGNHDYENTDAQEEAIYQNMIFSNGKSFPESRKNNKTSTYSTHEFEKSRGNSKIGPKSNVFMKTSRDASKNVHHQSIASPSKYDKEKVHMKG